MAMWRILFLQIKSHIDRFTHTILFHLRDIHAIDYVIIYVLPIFSISLLNGFLISIYKYRYDQYDAISIFAINRTRYLMITASKDDPIGELRLDSWLNAANNRRLANYVDVIQNNDLESVYLLRRRKAKKIRLYCLIWSVTIINDTLINSGTSSKNTLVIFTGWIDSCTTDDQFCVVLGHSLEDRPSSSLNNILSFLAEINEDEPFETKQHFDITARELEFEADIVPAFLASRLCVNTRDVYLRSILRIPLPNVEFYPIEKRNDVRTNHWYTSKENSTHPERMAKYDSLLKTLPRFFETSFYWWSYYSL